MAALLKVVVVVVVLRSVGGGTPSKTFMEMYFNCGSDVLLHAVYIRTFTRKK